MKVRKVVQMPRRDPAGLDELLLAAARGVTTFVEGKLAQRGFRTNLWEGQDGLGQVMREALDEAGVPNKRFQDLMSPRSIAERAGVVKKRKRVRR